MRLGTAARSPVLQTALGVAELWNAIEKLGWLLRSTVKTRSLLSGNCVGDMSAATLTVAHETFRQWSCKSNYETQ